MEAWSNLYYISIFVLMGIGVLGTILVGVSRTNREGDPTYFSKTNAKWTRLILFYIICFGAAVLALIAYIVRHK
ncbi:hypothetical protein SAMN05443246_2198 [Paenibacillus sp. GP183]|jgi:hypothetical protein|nr:hypothetical protein SAMN05443246_2198 [Paenibacillus sp. GP183]